MTHQDVAGVIAELKKADELYKTGDVPYYAIEELDSLLERSADLIESQAQALSEAEAERDAWRDRESETQEALQAIGDEFGIHPGEPRVDGVRRIMTEMRSRLAEAMRVIEQLRDWLILAGDLTCREVPLGIARDFLNTKEKT